MGEKKEIIRGDYDLDAKWDASIDLTVRRVVYSSFAAAFGGLLLFRSPQTRWATIAFGAGVGIGSAYTECSRLFDAPTSKVELPSEASTTKVTLPSGAPTTTVALPSEAPTAKIALPSEAPTAKIALPSEAPTQDSE